MDRQRWMENGICKFNKFLRRIILVLVIACAGSISAMQSASRLLLTFLLAFLTVFFYSMLFRNRVFNRDILRNVIEILHIAK